MPVQTVVRILREYLQDEGESLGRRLGPEVVAVAQDVKALLDVRLRAESAYEPVWTRFLADPPGVEAGLVGALEAHIEADPALAKRLNGFVEEYHRAIAPFQGRPVGPGVGKSPVGGGVPDTTFTAEDDTSVGEGTYLYGNVRSSDVASVGRGIAGGEPELGRQRRIEGLGPEEHEVRELFERIYAALELDTRIDPALAAEVKAAVREIEVEIGKGAAADAGLIRYQLSSVEQLSPYGLEIVLDQLAAPAIGMHLLPVKLFQYVRELQQTRRMRDGS
jgi:hypothetical protein